MNSLLLKVPKVAAASPITNNWYNKLTIFMQEVWLDY